MSKDSDENYLSNSFSKNSNLFNNHFHASSTDNLNQSFKKFDALEKLHELKSIEENSKNDFRSASLTKLASESHYFSHSKSSRVIPRYQQKRIVTYNLYLRI